MSKVNDDSVFDADPPNRMANYQVFLLFGYHVLLAILLAYAVYNVWPQQPWPGDKATKTAVNSDREAANVAAGKAADSQAQKGAENRGNATSAGENTKPATPDTGSPVSAASLPAGTQAATNSPAQSNTSPATEGKTAPNLTADEFPPPFYLFGRKFQPQLETRFILLVLLAGAIGSYVHAASSFVDYLGNRTLISSWVWWYLLRPFIGMMLALIFYFVFRGGFITAGANQGGEGAASFINPFGIAALAGLVGMFSKVASDKLNEVFTTLFRPATGQGDAKRGDKLGANLMPTISSIAQNQGPVAGGTSVVISGTGFVDGMKVTFGNVAASSVVVSSPTSLTAVTPPHAAEVVDVELTNPNNQKAQLKGSYTYKP